MVYEDVYEPNEDTYLLIDALTLESRNYIKNMNVKKVVEYGVGSGAVINTL